MNVLFCTPAKLLFLALLASNSNMLDLVSFFFFFFFNLYSMLYIFFTFLYPFMGNSVDTEVATTVEKLKVNGIFQIFILCMVW